MKLKLLPKSRQGSILKTLHLSKYVPKTDVGKAILLTGANGSGKTALIDSIAISAGLAGRYASSKTTYQFSSMDVQDAKRDYWGASLVEGTEPAKFDLVLRYRGEDLRKGVMSLDTLEDVMQVMGVKGSHGQVALYRFGKLLTEAQEFLESDPNVTLLFLIDEPETAVAPDMLLLMVDRLFDTCLRAVKGERLVAVIATQSPFLVFGSEAAGATRIDLGGWRGGVDPFPELARLAGAGYHKLGSSRDMKKPDSEGVKP